MKTLYVIRHAKSSWAIPGQSDFQRSLNERGMKDAPDMASRLQLQNRPIDVFVSSPALRARQTCELFCGIYGVPLSSICFVDTLYHAPEDTIYQAVENIDNRFSSAAIFSHNPGITDFVNSLCKKVTIDNMPTCAVFAVTIHEDSWADFRAAEKNFLFFDYPKKSSSFFSK